MDDLAKVPDPFGEGGFARLWQEVDRLFAQTFQAFARSMEEAGARFNLQDLLPRIDLERQGSEVVAIVRAPGVRPDSLEVAVTAEHLTVRGEAETPQSYRAFHRTVPLPARVRPEAARTEQRPDRLVVRIPVV